MTYRILGLAPEPFAPLFALGDDELSAHGARSVVATTAPGFPCRISLVDAAPGERLILVHHVSHDVATPFRSAYAIYVREAAQAAAEWIDQVPPVFDGRTMALRGFDAEHMLRGALLAPPGEADAGIREMFRSDEIAYIDAHNAAAGCFAARVTRA